MLLLPSIDRLVEQEPSKYKLIILASKRAHEMQKHPLRLLDKYQSVKTIGQALEEIEAGELSGLNS